METRGHYLLTPDIGCLPKISLATLRDCVYYGGTTEWQGVWHWGSRHSRVSSPYRKRQLSHCTVEMLFRSRLFLWTPLTLPYTSKRLHFHLRFTLLLYSYFMSGQKSLKYFQKLKCTSFELKTKKKDIDQEIRRVELEFYSWNRRFNESVFWNISRNWDTKVWNKIK